MRKFDKLNSKIINFHPSDLEVVDLGTIDLFDDEYMEREIDSFIVKDLKPVHIQVYSGTGFIPHFRLVSENGKFHTCICIDKPEYFHYGKYNGFLSSNQKKLLNEQLQQKAELLPNLPKVTIWQNIVITWNNDKTNKFKVDISKNMPDYTLLPGRHLLHYLL